MSTAAPKPEHAIIKTSYGEMTLAFWPDVAPKTVENFKKLAREGFYNGTAFHRISAAADFIEQHERGQFERALHFHDVGDARREGAEARADRLVVADVGEHRLERRELAAALDGNEQPGLRHHHEEAEGLQGDGFAAGVGPRDHERFVRRRDQQV